MKVRPDQEACYTRTLTVTMADLGFSIGGYANPRKGVPIYFWHFFQNLTS